MSAVEDRLADAVNVDALRIVRAVERPGHRLTKYSFVFNGLQRGAAVAWLLAALLEFIRY